MMNLLLSIHAGVPSELIHIKIISGSQKALPCYATDDIFLQSCGPSRHARLSRSANIIERSTGSE